MDAGQLLEKTTGHKATYNNGREASAIVKCKKCGGKARISACADVGGVWVRCRECDFEWDW
jgi:RNase P subunit RPR2